MNKDRRKRIAALVLQLDTIKDEIETLRGEEQDYFDAMPEGIQAGPKGDASQSAYTSLEEAVDYIESVIGSLNEGKE